MELLLAVTAIAGAVLIGAMSPGPSFILVASTAVAVSRRDALAASLGMGLGGMVFATAALLGLHVILTSAPSIYFALKIIGAIYLIYLATRLWKGARAPLESPGLIRDRLVSQRKSFILGFVTQLSNPKTAIVYASIFTALVPEIHSAGVAVTILGLIFAVESGWYAIIAIAFSSDTPRRRYLQSKVWIDRAAGGVMALLAVKLISDTRA
jgi:threonine/homoserine/homoserine lactone efflux protein